ncbi:MAG: hypothetical protein K2K44_09180 [Oscillospiraceae bacterium]|nr:hypothetical protein [Oscillospiraceae bacterium]
MKKIIIAAVVIAILAVASALLITNKNNAASAEAGVETNVVMLLNDGSVSAVTDKSLTQDEVDIIEIIDTENRIAVMLSDLDKINSAQINIAADNSSVTAVLDISEELSPDETDGVVKLIMMSLNGIEKEDVVIFDQNNNVIFLND